MSSMSEESLQENPKNDNGVLSRSWMALSKIPQEFQGVEEKFDSTQLPLTFSEARDESSTMQLSSYGTSFSHRCRYSKAELEVHSSRAKLPADCTESSLEVVRNLQRSEKSPFVKPKSSPFDSSSMQVNNLQRGRFSVGEEHREPATTYRHFPRKDEFAKRKHHKQSELPRAYETKSKLNRNQKPYPSSRKLVSEVWYYRDPQNNIQGPFSLIQLREWLEAGYYDGTLSVCEEGSSSFQPLNSVLETFKTHSTPPGMDKSRDDTVAKDISSSLDKSKLPVGKLEPVTNKSRESSNTEGQIATTSTAPTLQKVSQIEDQAVLFALHSSQGEKEFDRIGNVECEETLDAIEDPSRQTKVEVLTQNNSRCKEDQTCHLIFGNDLSTSLVKESSVRQESIPLERDIAELERDLVSKLDLDSKNFSFESKGYSSSGDSVAREGNEGKISNQKSSLNPAEYLMSIDPAIAKASVRSKSASPAKNSEHANVAVSKPLTLEQNDLYKVQSSGENMEEFSLQHNIDTNLRPSDGIQVERHTIPISSNETSGDAAERSEEWNHLQGFNGTSGKRRTSHDKRKSKAAGTLHEIVESEKRASPSEGHTSHERSRQEKHQARSDKPQEQSASFSPTSEKKAFDNFFKAVTDSSKWNSWPRPASNLHYPLSLREVQLEEERRQREEALRAEKERKLGGLQVKRFGSWEKQPIKTAPFVEIQKHEIEHQASRMKSKSHDEENRAKGWSGSSWADKLLHDSSSHVLHQPSGFSSVEKPKDNDVVNYSRPTGFWSYVDHSLGANELKSQSYMTSSSTKESFDRYEASNTGRNGSFGAVISEDLRKWCEEQFSELIGSRDVTLAEFLASLKTREEIREYAIIYLGSSKRTDDFVQEFIRRLEFEGESQKVVTGSSGTQTFKSSRRKKKS